MVDVNNWAEIDGKLYFKSYQMIPDTFCFDMERDELEALEENTPEIWSRYAYFRTTSINNYVAFLPYYGKYFSIYDTVKRVFTYVKKETDANYRSSVVYKNKLFAFPDGDLKNIAVLNSDTLTVQYPFLHETKMGRGNQYGEICIDEQYAYICLEDEDKLLKLNLDTYSYECVELIKTNSVYGIIIKRNDKFYLAGNHKFILCWDGKCGFRQIDIKDGALRGEKIKWTQLFSDVIAIKDNLYFAPLNYNAVICLNTLKNDIKVIYLQENDMAITWGVRNYKDSIYICWVDISGRAINSNIISETGKVIEKDLFELTDKIDLCMYGYEYSEYALKIFISNIVNK